MSVFVGVLVTVGVLVAVGVGVGGAGQFFMSTGR